MSASVIFSVEPFLHSVIDKPHTTEISCVNRYWFYFVPVCILGKLLGILTVPMRFFDSTVGVYVSCYAVLLYKYLNNFG